MEKVLRLALQRPVTVMIGMTALVVGCLFVLGMLPLVKQTGLKMDIFPDLNQPVIYVAQPYGGMDPAQMEGLITNYYEYAFLFMNGIHHVESRNVQNIALVKLYFQPGTNMAQAVAEAAIYANRAKAFFPPGTVTPFIMSLDASMVPVAYVTLSSDSRSVDELADLMLFRVRPKLASLKGTTAPQPFGGSLRSIVVNLNPERLRAYNVSPEEVARALDKGNTITPSGNARVRDQMPIVSVNSIVVNPQDLGNIPIKPEENLYLRDLGTVQDTTDIPTGWALVNGRRAVYMPILKTAEASLLTVATQLRDNMDDMRSVLPRDCKLDLEFDQSPNVTGAVGSVQNQSLLGALLTGMMVLLFLRDWRAVIVVVLSIPLSLMGGLIGLFVTGQTINLMTLGGLSLAIGIIEGTAIVVIENIHTQLGKAQSVPQAVLAGTAETMVPILLSILCILAVFMPSFLMEGAARSLFVPLAISVGFSLVTAFVVSVTFVPVLSIWLLKSHAAAEQTTAGAQPEGWYTFAGFRSRYLTLVERVLARRKVVLWGYVVGCAVVLGLVGPQLGQEISPQVDAGQFQMRLKAPVGSRLEVTEELTRQALKEIAGILGTDGVKISVAHIGQTAPTFTANAVFLWTSGPDQAVIRIALRKEKGFRTQAVLQQLRDELPGKLQPWLQTYLTSVYDVAPDVARQRAKQVAVSFEPADAINQVMSFGSPTPIEVVISGPNQDDNRKYAERVSGEMAKIPTLRDLQFGQAFDYPRVKVEIDRERAGLANVKVSEAANAMIAATSSSRYIVPVYWADPKSGIGYQVQLQVPPAQMNSIDEVGMIPVKQNAGRPATLLRDVARVTDSTMPQEYDRINQRRIVSITANVVGEDLGRAVRRIEAAITAAGEPPRGVKIGDDQGHIRGQVPAMRQMFSGLASGLGMAVVVVFLLLTAYFQSARLALVSVATTPAVVAGVALALYLTNNTLNTQSFMGAIMAVGVAVANAILLVVFAEKARQAGIGAGPGALIGTRDRLRAILMTSGAMIAGMVPLALALGKGGEQSAPLGWAVIGGLSVATAVTLLVLPAIFAVLMSNSKIGSASLHPDDPDGAYYTPPRPAGARH